MTARPWPSQPAPTRLHPYTGEPLDPPGPQWHAFRPMLDDGDRPRCRVCRLDVCAPIHDRSRA